MNVEWVTWGLQLLVGVLLARVWMQLDKNTEAIADLREHLPLRYVHKNDYNEFRKETDTSIHDLRNGVHSADTQTAELRVQVDALMAK